jgi:glycosyltransferase involved in cell wall biosynthesis
MQLNVSVIIPILRNYNNFLEEALNTIQFQSYQPKEIIVIGNIYNNRKIKEICKKFKKCFFFGFKKEHASAKRFYGLSKARSRYIAFLDYDDLWPKHRLRHLVKKINNNFYAYGGQCPFYKDRKKIIFMNKILYSELLTNSLIKKKIMISEHYLKKNHILTEFLFYKRLSLNKNKIYKIKNIVTYRRIHANNFSNRRNKKYKLIDTLRHLIKI